MNRQTMYALCIGTILITSCVSNKKYTELLLEKGHLQQDYDKLLQTKEELADCREQNINLSKELNIARGNYADVVERYEDLSTNYDRLDKQYQRQVQQNTSLLDQTSSENRSLTEAIAEQQRALDDQKQALERAESALDEKQGLIQEMVTNLDERSQRIHELEAIANDQKKRLNTLRSSINEALSGLSSDDLSIYEKDGKIYVSLSHRLLFSTGSYKLDDNGRSALKKLAGSIKDLEDMEIQVEGHTDSDGSSTSNWDLSVGRATEVVKTLMRAGVKPERMLASGRGEHFPVADNDSENGKAQNRRTEIIIAPNLNKIIELLN